MAKVPPTLRFADRYTSEVKYPDLGLVIRKVDTSNSTSRWVGEYKQRTRLGNVVLTAAEQLGTTCFDFW